MFSFSIDYTRTDGKGGGMSGGGYSLEVARERLLKDMAYYAAMGYTITSAPLFVVCDTCRGEGKVSKCRRKFCQHYSPTCFRVCPTCKGNHTHTVTDYAPQTV